MCVFCGLVEWVGRGGVMGVGWVVGELDELCEGVWLVGVGDEGCVVELRGCEEVWGCGCGCLGWLEGDWERGCEFGYDG